MWWRGRSQWPGNYEGNGSVSKRGEGGIGGVDGEGALPLVKRAPFPREREKSCRGDLGDALAWRGEVMMECGSRKKV